MDLSERLARYLACVPPAIEGENGSGVTFYLACQLVNGFALTGDEALVWLRLYNARCQPPWSEKELEHKVADALNAKHDKPRGHLAGNGALTRRDFKVPAKPAEPVPKIDPATAMENWLRGFRCTEQDLYDASPIKPADDCAQDGVLLVSHLFAPGERVNFITDFTIYTRKSDGLMKSNPQGYGESVERDDLIARWTISGMPASDAGGWMRMNPVDGEGVDDANVTAFRYALLEWDGIPLDLQISFLARVPLPIDVILTSGGKSVHAWVRVDAQNREEYEAAFVSLRDVLFNFGLDRKNKNPSRLSRLPGVKRVVGASGDGWQRILYLAPNAEQEAIL